MKRSWKQFFLYGVVAGFIVIGSFYAVAVYKARESTVERVARAQSEIRVAVSKDALKVHHYQWLLEVQDANFWEHGGTDFSSGKITTITQGLSKFLYFKNFKPGIAKIEQSLIARFALNDLVSKEDQFQLFLSRAYFGNFRGKSVLGIGEAALTFFKKSITEVSDGEFISLLVMLSAPNGLNVASNPAGNMRASKKLLKQLSLTDVDLK
jgi:membrane carboxypeptidase/penicillin-binding protein